MPPAPTVPYRTARIATAVISALVWAAILGLLGIALTGAMGADGLSAAEARGLLVTTCLFVPLFTGHGALVGMMDGLVDGRFDAPPPLAPQPGARSENPWVHGLRLMGAIGVPAALAWAWLAPQLFTGEVARYGLVGALVAAGAVLAAVAGAASDRAFRRAVCVPSARRPYPASDARYRLRRHVLPQALVNAAINAVVGVGIVTKPGDAWLALAPGELVLGDTGITALIVYLSVFAGTRGHARADTRWGILVTDAARDGAFVARPLLWAVATAAAAVTAALLLVTVSGPTGVPLPTFVLFKTLAAAAVATSAALRGQRAGRAAA